MRYRLLARLDGWGHRVNAPGWLLRPVCRRYEAYNMGFTLDELTQYELWAGGLVETPAFKPNKAQ